MIVYNISSGNINACVQHSEETVMLRLSCSFD